MHDMVHVVFSFCVYWLFCAIFTRGKNLSRAVSGKKWCPSGGRAAGRHAFVSGPLFENHYTYIYEIWHIFGPYGLVVPFGGHIAIAYIVFPYLWKIWKKKFFFRLRTRTSKKLDLYAWKFDIKCIKYPRCAFWGFKCFHE